MISANASFEDSKELEYLGGLAYMGKEGDREAYQLPFVLPISSQSLSIFECLAQRLDGKLDFSPNLSICLPQENEPLLEICDGQMASYVLVPTNCSFKAYLLQSTFEALVFGLVNSH